MATYLISYDLRKQRNYENLWSAIKTYSSNRRVLESLWIVVTPKTAKEIRDHLSLYMDNDDGLIVIKSGREAAWRNIICEDQWLKDNL